MIERTADGAAGARTEFRLRANRSVSASGLLAFFAVLAGWSIAVAAFSAGQGNVFAPFFAAAELSVVAVCLGIVWRQLGRIERIAFTPEAVQVAGGNGATAEFDPHWVRVERWPGGRAGRARLVLTSHGRAVEVGAFLADAECVALEAQLKQALARCRAVARATDRQG